MLHDQVAFITGSTRGIGWQTAQVLARQGATVVVNGTDPTRVSERARELSELAGRPCEGIACDVSRPDEIKRAYQELFRRYKRLDVLVNNAGILEDALIGMIPDELISRSYAVNVVGALHNLQAAARLMMRAGRGAIVNVSSIIGTHGNEGQAVYGSTKAALVGLTLSAAKELAPKGIRVNAVAPGFIDTDMTRGLPPDKFQQRLAGVRMGRLGSPEEVANVCLFLASPLASYVTGQVVGVDGGMIV